jgi:hypothetical protein
VPVQAPRDAATGGCGDAKDMIRSIRPGQLLLAAALALFGAQYLIEASPPAGAAAADFYRLHQLVPIGRPPGAVLCWVVGIALIVAALLIAASRAAPWAAAVTGAALVLDSAIVYLPGIVMKPSSPLTGCFELLAIGGGTWMLAAALAQGSGPRPDGQRWMVAPVAGMAGMAGAAGMARLGVAGRVLLVISLLVFGFDHFRFATFVASLVPAWLPGHMFWTILFGVAFIAAAVSFATRAQERLAGTLLGAMFMIWFLTLHLPRSFAAPTNGNEWTSAFVALALWGSSWIVAGTARQA